MKIVFLSILFVLSMTMCLSCANNQANQSSEGNSGVSQSVNDVFENCVVTTSEDFVKLVKDSRNAEETEIQLPLNLRFGMSQQEYKDTIFSVLKQVGGSNEKFPKFENGLGCDFVFANIALHVNPVFTPNDKLYQLEMFIDQNSIDNQIEDPVRQLMEFYVAKNPLYESFEKYTIDYKFYFAKKGNHLIVPDKSNSLLLFFNVPQIPEKQYNEIIGNNNPSLN